MGVDGSSCFLLEVYIYIWKVFVVGDVWAGKKC